MQGAIFKFGGGTVVLLASLVFWWTTEEPSADYTGISSSEIEWAAFPVLQTGNYARSQKVHRTRRAKVLFVYSPHQCYSNRNAMDGWHRAPHQVEEVQAANVLLERGRLSAQRYLNAFSTPYRTRLDSTGWFRNTLDLSTTPAVVLVSDDGPEDIFYPTDSALSDEQRQRHVQRLVNPTDS